MQCAHDKALIPKTLIYCYAVIIMYCSTVITSCACAYVCYFRHFYPFICTTTVTAPPAVPLPAAAAAAITSSNVHQLAHLLLECTSFGNISQFICTTCGQHLAIMFNKIARRHPALPCKMLASVLTCLQCTDTLGWASGKSFRPVKNV